MKVKVIASLREFDALAPAWSDVTRESGGTSPFLSHDWFACCWRAAGPNRRREVWMLEDAAGPVGFVPLARWRTKLHGLPVRMLGFLESPDTPFVDFPVARDLAGTLRFLFDHLTRQRDWDVLMLRKVRVDSDLWRVLEGLLPASSRWQPLTTEQSPYVRIAGTWERFLSEKTQRFRKTCRNIENRLRREGAVTVEEHREVDPDGPLFNEVLQVSSQSWKAPRGFAMATMLGMPRFFRELTRRASANGWLHLWIMRIDGRPVATEYQIGDNGSLHALRADYDDSHADISPGAGLNVEIVRSLFRRQGMREYDMGPGAREYKLRWATDAHEMAALHVYAPSAYGAFLHSVETSLMPLARRVRSRIRELCA